MGDNRRIHVDGFSRSKKQISAIQNKTITRLSEYYETTFVADRLTSILLLSNSFIIIVGEFNEERS